MTVCYAFFDTQSFKIEAQVSLKFEPLVQYHG